MCVHHGQNITEVTQDLQVSVQGFSAWAAGARLGDALHGLRLCCLPENALILLLSYLTVVVLDSWPN